jgi:CHAD domain-containing protein
MERVLKELENVRTSPDPDAVHDLRVAIRRCRSVAAVMEEVDPDPAWPEMRKLGRKLFRQLGELRDTQVLEDWTKKLGPEADPIRMLLLADFEKKERELRETALRAAAKFDQKTWKKYARLLQRRARRVPLESPAAECLALERLEAARKLHTQALRTEKAKPWHKLRIGVKRFRYTVESLLPERYAVWGDNLKRVQDLLGAVHDLDVLSETIAQIAAEEPADARARWTERNTSERHERIETYRQLTLGKTSLWHEWRQGLPHGARLEEAALARLRVTTRALDTNPRRTGQISRLAMRIYDALGRVHAAPAFGEARGRKVMRVAALLHGIGASLDTNSPQKAARNFLRDMALPTGWTPAEWELLANVVRYHRGAQPEAKHKSFARLSEQEKKAVCALAGVLRLARVLRKCGCETTAGLRVDKSVEALIMRVPGLKDTEETAARLAAGKHLLESAVERPLILKAAPVALKVVELPKKEEGISTTAVASD